MFDNCSSKHISAIFLDLGDVKGILSDRYPDRSLPRSRLGQVI